MSDISSQLIKDSYNYVLQSDVSTGNIYRIGGGIPVNPIFLSGLTINSSFNFSNGSEQSGYVLTSDSSGNATWSPAGSSSGDYLPLSGGTVSGRTIFTSGLTANTISSGNVLIGTTVDSGFKLDVNGTARVSGVLTVGDVGGAAYDFQIRKSTSVVARIRSTNSVDSAIYEVQNNLTTGISLTARGSTAPVLGFIQPNEAALYANIPINIATSSSPISIGVGSTKSIFIPNNNNVLIGTTTDIASSKLTIASTTQGFLPPRMTTVQKNAITTPATGLTVYDTTLGRQSIYNGSVWDNLQPSAVQLGSQTLSFSAWTLSGSYYTYIFSNANITSTSIVDFTPNNASINEVSSSLMLPQVDVASGSCTFYATFPPQSNITGTINIWQ